MPETLDKASLRQKLLRRRDSIPSAVRKVKSGLIMERLFSLEEIRNAAVLFSFASFRSEVRTIELIHGLLSAGKRVVLPKVERENRALLLCEITTLEEVSQGYMGIPEPSGDAAGRIVTVNDVDVVIIPGAGFDLAGNRIGYGGGYYDRLLSALGKDIPIIAPAFEEQVVDAIPSEPHDRKVSMIVTDRRTITISPS